MRIISVLIVCLWAWNASAATGIQCQAPDGIARSAVIRVSGDDGSQASGVVVAQDLVLTAAHVVSGAGSVFVGYDNTLYQARVLVSDPSKDLALLRAPTGNRPRLPISRRVPLLWQPVWAVGYPLAREQVAMPGFFEKLYNGGLQTTADVQSGQSGGALMSCERGSPVLAGIIRGFGAYPNDQGGYERIADFSISVSPMDIWTFMEAGSLAALTLN